MQRMFVSIICCFSTYYAVAPSAQNLGLNLGLRYLSTDGTPGSATAYIYAGENPIARHTSAGTEYYLEDATDSIRALTSSTGTVIEVYNYDAFGNVLSGSDSPELGYHAAWHDESGLIDMRLRSYDPVTGRFTSVDPAQPIAELYETFNPYAFANQNSLVFSDPLGAFTITEINISQSMQTYVKNSKQVVVREIRDRLQEKVSEFVAELFVNTVAGFIPGGEFLQLLNDDFDAGKELDKDLSSLFSEVPFKENVWLQPTLMTSGRPTEDGISPVRGGSRITKAGQHLPDYIFKSEHSRPTDLKEPGWVVGDFKLSVGSLLTQYFDRGATKKGQWSSIAGYARRFNQIPVAFFITWNPGNSTQIRKIKKESISEGVGLVIVSLRP